MGDDFCDNSKEAIENIAKYEASVGVTTIAPATMTLPVEELEAILRTAAEYKKEQNPKGADLVGVNMEGPFISPVKKVHRMKETSCLVIRKSVRDSLMLPKGS